MLVLRYLIPFVLHGYFVFHEFNNDAFILLRTIAFRSKLDNSSRYFILLLLPLAEFRAGIEFLCIVSRSNAIQ